MIEVAADIVIGAAPDRVWRTLTDFARFRQWHPFLELEGVPEKGTKVHYWFRLKPDGPRQWDTTAWITELETQRALVLELGIPFLLRIEERFELSREANGTLLKHIARFRGLLPAMMPRKFIQRRAIHIYRTPIEWLQRYFATATPPVPQPPQQGPNRFQRRSVRSRR